MATKIIPASTILETPDVNVLNDNIIEDVDYSYNNTYFAYKNVASFLYQIFDMPAPDGNVTVNNVPKSKYYTDISKYKRADSQNINIIGENIPHSSVEWYYDFIRYTFNVDGQVKDDFKVEISQNDHLNQPSLSQHYSYLISNSTSQTIYDTPQQFNSYDDLKADWFISNQLGQIQYVKITIGGIKIGIVKEGTQYTAYILLLTYANNTTYNEVGSLNADYSIRLSIKSLMRDNISTGYNSIVSLQSNELIQDNTKIDNTQISSYIADNIKSYYANGKTTMNLVVDYTGDNEYEIGDIVQPMQDADEPVMKYSDGTPMEFEVTSNQISYNGKGTQNLELVEKVYIKHTLTIPTIMYTPPYPGSSSEWAARIVVKDSDNNTYADGAQVQDGTNLTITVNMRYGNYILKKLYVNGSEITNGSTVQCDSDMTISIEWDSIENIYTIFNNDPYFGTDWYGGKIYSINDAQTTKNYLDGESIYVNSSYPLRIYWQVNVSQLPNSWTSELGTTITDLTTLQNGVTKTVTARVGSIEDNAVFTYSINDTALTITNANNLAKAGYIKVEASYKISHTN